jgi:glycosyltransferase involved in cell wall biosynthesis
MMDTEKTVLSIIVPLFNEEKVLPLFVERLRSVLNDIDESYEVLLVDDGSRDRTYEVICQIAGEDSRIRGLMLSRNFGKEAALLAGLEHATGHAVVIIDGDGQHPPELLPKMVEAWKSGHADIVSCVKEERQTDSLVKRVNAAVFNWLMKSLSGMDFSGASDYRLLDRRVADAVVNMKERVRFFRGMTTWVGFREVRIPFSVSERMAGDSAWPNRQLVKLALSALTSFTAKPLFGLVVTGIIGILISFVLGVQALISWLMGIAVSGWTSLTLVILFFGSANLMAVGIVGVYVSRVFDEVKKRPVYLLRQTCGLSGPVEMDKLTEKRDSGKPAQE